MKKGKGELIGYNMDVKFGGFYSPNPDQQDEIMYMVIGDEDGWYYLNKEQFKTYYDYINEVKNGETNR